MIVPTVNTPTYNVWLCISVWQTVLKPELSWNYTFSVRRWMRVRQGPCDLNFLSEGVCIGLCADICVTPICCASTPQQRMEYVCLWCLQMSVYASIWKYNRGLILSMYVSTWRSIWPKFSYWRVYMEALLLYRRHFTTTSSGISLQYECIFQAVSR